MNLHHSKKEYIGIHTKRSTKSLDTFGNTPQKNPWERRASKGVKV